MTRRLWPSLLAVLGVMAFGLIAAGCGDDDEGDTSSDEPAVEETTDGGTVDTGDADVDAAVQAAIDSCKSSVGATPGISDDVIADLESICEEAASGDVEAAQQATVDVCVKIAEETVPAGSAQDTAVEACQAAAP